MVRKRSMKKKITLFFLAMLVLTGVGTSTGRKYLRFVGKYTQHVFKKYPEPARDSASVAQLQLLYHSYRDTVEIKRKYFTQKYLAAATAERKKAVLKDAGVYLRHVLTEKIYPCWYGTEWDFNGITETPCQGKIACGYFVSTTLRHTGVNVNRYKLAQKYSHAIVKSVCTDVKVFSGFGAMLTHLKDQPDDVYVVGLDTHVGILSKKDAEIHFIHSSYVGPAYVISEEAEQSPVLGSSRSYVLGNMTSNTSLIKAWLMGTAVKIVE